MDNVRNLRASAAFLKRSSKACEMCRIRKVRCDALERGQPCTKCSIHGDDCVLSPVSGDKRKRPRRPSSADNVARPRRDTVIDPSEFQLQDILYGMLDIITPGTSLSQADSPIRQLSESTEDSPRETTPPPQEPSSSRSSITAALPSFIKPPPPGMSLQDLKTLKSQGALSIPGENCRNALILAYIKYIYPYLPILDVGRFFQALCGTDGQVDLILWHAIMVSGSMFVDMEDLRPEGYLHRGQARKDFTNRVKVLYELGYESEPLDLVHALLLVCCPDEKQRHMDDTIYWLERTVSVAKSIDLHTNPEHLDIDSSTQRLRKRLWWCLFLRVQVGALTTHSTTHFHLESHDVPMLTMADFEIGNVRHERYAAYDVKFQRTAASMCIEMVKICVCIQHILRTKYKSRAMVEGPDPEQPTELLKPKEPDMDVADVESCIARLQSLFTDLSQTSNQLAGPTGDAVLDARRCLLHLIFWAATTLLHRPLLRSQSAQGTPDPAATPGTRKLLQKDPSTTRDAAMSIANLVQDLEGRGIVRYLPFIGVAILMPAIFTFLLDLRGADETVRQSSLIGFSMSVRTLGRLPNEYIFGRPAIDALHDVVQQMAPANSSDASSTSGVDCIPRKQRSSVEDIIAMAHRIHLVTSRDQISGCIPRSLSIETSLPDHLEHAEEHSRDGSTIQALHYPSVASQDEAGTATDMPQTFLDPSLMSYLGELSVFSDPAIMEAFGPALTWDDAAGAHWDDATVGHWDGSAGANWDDAAGALL